MSKVSKLIFGLALLAPLPGCGGNIATIVLQCPEAWKEVRINRDDKLTERTAQAIEGNNDARIAMGCKPGKPEAVAATKPAPIAPSKADQPTS
jgi:hypothetical protein